MDKVLKAAVRSLSSASTFDSGEDTAPDNSHHISLESNLRSLDEDDAQLRISEEESLNKLIYSYIRKQKGSSRILDELCREIKRTNIGPTSLRVCLSALSHIHIKPQKLGPTISNTLFPSLLEIIRQRKESEIVLSAIADNIDPLMTVFGPYALSNEVEHFITTLITLLLNGGEGQSPSQIRSISVCLCSVASHNKARHHFISWTFCKLVSEYVSNYYCTKVNEFQSALLGLFTACRALIPLLNDIEDSYNVLQDTELERHLFMLYELSLSNLELFESVSHSLISANLELLHQILKNPPLSLKVKLLSTQGFSSRYLEESPDKSMDLSSQDECSVKNGNESLTKNTSTRKGGILGSFVDKDIPLIYAARLIVSKTLLTPEKGVPRTDIRISIRSLAISCMSAIVSLSPKIFLLTLYVDQDEEDFESTPLLRDIAAKDHFVLHADPQLSGSTAILLGNVLRGCLLETGGNGIDFWFNQRRPDHEDIIAIFMDLISKPDISSISIKYALVAIRSFIGIMLRSSLARQASLLLFEVVSDNHALWQNSYWIVKTALLELLSSVDFKLVHFVNGNGFHLQKKLFYILKRLLMDEDARVRSSAAEAIVQSIPNLYYPNDWVDECTESASRSCSLIKTSLESVIRRVADWLWEHIAAADNNFQLSGFLEAYFILKSKYMHGSNSIDASVLDLLSHFITSNSNFTLDINNHILSLNVLSLILSIGVSHTKSDIFRHCVRILNMMYHLIEDPTVHTYIPSNTGTGHPSSNPSGEGQSIKKEDEVNDQRRLGNFGNSPHYLKVFLSLKNIYGTYIISPPSTKADPSNKFNLLLKNVLKTLTSLLAYRCIESCDEDLAKEILRYLSSTISLDPFNTLSCVQGLLSYIFKTSDESPIGEIDVSSRNVTSTDGVSFYKYGFEMPYEEFVAQYKLPKPTPSSSISFFDDKINLKRLPTPFLKRALSLKNWNRDALTSYIRLFEPIVIQALQFYIITSRVNEQGQVLSLLIQLVKLRVNYCLLDSDKVFVGYVLRHLEHIRDGHVLNAEIIIPKIFQFLVLLSVDKFHSKVVVPVNDIVDHLTELTSTKNPKWIILAVYPVVEVLFGNWHIHDNMATGDLEAIREKLFKLLLNYMNHPEILEVFISKLCFVKSEGEDRWRKVSRILFDNILALLSTQKIQLHDSNSLRTLYSFFLCLAPGTLRPVDSLLSSVLTSAVDLGSVEDVQRWLGFVVVSLCIITNQSPEEGILSRLEEFGITLISNSPSNEVGCSVKPECTFAKFLFQVIGASLSKLHQIVYSLEQSDSYLEEEVYLLLNFVVYVLKSGRFCRVTKAAQSIAEGKDIENLLYSLDFINNIALELSHAYPFVTLRWTWILTLLKRVQTPYWSKLISFNSHFLSLGKAILQKGSLIVLCEYLCETNPMEEYNVELVTWLVSNFSHLIVENIEEEPVRRFVQSVHNKASSSGLFLQAIISRCQHRLSSSVLFQKKALIALDQVHDSHSSNLLTFLIQRLSPRAHLSLSARIQRLCCKRVEGILNSGSPRELLSSEELSNAVDHLKQLKFQQRYGRLIALLNELMSEWYPDLNNIVDSDDGRSFSPSSLLGLKPNKAWFLSQLKNKCSLRDLYSSRDTEQCARMLTWLSSEEDITSIISSQDFNISIIEWLFRDSSTSTMLLKTCKEQFFHYHLKKIVDKHLPLGQFVVYGPNDWASSASEARYKDKMDSNFSSKSFRDTFIKSLSIFSVIPKELLNYETDIAYLKRVPFLLSLEFLKWLYFYCTKDDVKGMEELTQVAFMALDYVFKNPSISSQLSIEEATPGIHALYSVLRGDEDISLSRTPTCLRYKELIKERGSKNSIVLAALKINRLFALYLNNEGERLWNKKYLRGPISNTILGLARLPYFNSYVSIPLEVWKLGWSDGVPFGPNEMKFPLLSLDHLQEIDILTEYTIRVNAIGWSDRPQFEETWMSLLGIFSIIQDDMSNSDIYFLSHCSALVVRTATNLLLKTLCIPHPGLSNTSGFLSHSRLTPSEFMNSSRGKALFALQSKMNELLHEFASSGALPIYSSQNLENICSHSSYCGSGQISSSYILAGIKYYEGEAFDINEASVPQSFRLREEALAVSGLDMDSCLQFLFDLYSSWFKNPGETPLVLLTEAVRSIVALSDIFTTKSSFKWMYRHFVEIFKKHPSEDEILISLLRVGICKALSILGVSILYGQESDSEVILPEEQFKRLIERGYNSSYLPAQFSSLQGVLYVLQRYDLFNDETSHIFNFLVRNSIEYLKDSLLYVTNPCHDAHAALCWSLTFFILENCDFMAIDIPWTTNILQLALSTPGKTNTSSKIYLILLSGFERLILAGKLSKTYPGSGIRAMDQVIKLTTDLLTESNPILVIPSIQLFLSTMYIGGNPIMNSGDAPSTPERLMHAMEQISILFDCIRRSGPKEAHFLCQILPLILVEFFPAADVINRVISEFISPGQPHQPLLAGVMFSVFNQASQEHSSMLQDWVLSTLPTFTKRSPISHSAWCLSCFFLSVPPPSEPLSLEESSESEPFVVASDYWLQALFPHLQTRLGSFTSDDKKLFCLVAKEFYSHLQKESQRDKFLSAFKEVAHPKTPYYDLLQVI